MKLLKYELGEWRAKYGDNTDPCPNWFRSAPKFPGTPENDYKDYSMPHIGLRRQGYQKSVYDNVWRVDISDFPRDIKKLLESLFKSCNLSYSKKYKWDELSQAKQDIDNLITKINKLKCFI